ncbi:cupin domain-containing protein [Pendulispora albinea]|uniref:Cupin domain-containing protein n=1 Tax=Pendulispora albinea TaxID=2741071 RepID=A0ABZ2MBX3_9BACT
MNPKTLTVVAAAACLAVAVPVVAHGPGDTAPSGPHETVIPNFERVLPNVPGKSLVAVEVVFPPGVASRPHRHAKSAFIYGYVVSGTIQSQVEGEPPRTLKAGESFYESPGAHHLGTRNTSTTQPAKLLAVFVVDSHDKELTTPDK